MSKFFLSDFSINVLVEYSKKLIEKFNNFNEDIAKHREMIKKRVEKGMNNNQLLEKIIQDIEMRKKDIVNDLFILKKDLEKLGKTIVISDNGMYVKDYDTK
ncbi:MAG TPA: hypothetical protein PLD27_01835 [bacterium]|nr:hypothetical protein [bacterium]HOL48750.1 hypothetical protein [bacterium]HPQ18404.1 hypothetical protein [bacterium]